jgi:hypothetical protein
MPKLSLLLTAAAVLAATPAHAVQNNTPTGGDACLEQFNECQRGCGPSPSTANPACMKYCEEQVLAKCRSGQGTGAAVKGRVKPGAVQGGTVKSQ